MEPRKSVAAEFKADGAPGEFTARFAVFGNLDLDGDIIRKGAFEPAFKENPRPAIVWTHRWDIPPIGETLDAKESGTGAEARGKLFIDDHEVAKQVWVAIKSGALNQYSFSYDIDEFSLRDPKDGEKSPRFDGKVRELIAFSAVHEWGPTLRGANPQTETLSAKSILALLDSGIDPLDQALALVKAAQEESKRGARNSTKDAERLQTIHNLSVENGAVCQTEEDEEQDDGKSAPTPARITAVRALISASPYDPLSSGGS